MDCESGLDDGLTTFSEWLLLGASPLRVGCRHVVLSNEGLFLSRNALSAQINEGPFSLIFSRPEKTVRCRLSVDLSHCPLSGYIEVCISTCEIKPELIQLSSLRYIQDVW